MPALFTVLGIALIVVTIPFGLMFAPLTIGALFAYLGWQHLSAGWQGTTDGATS